MSLDEWAVIAFIAYWLVAILIAWIAEKQHQNGLDGCMWPIVLPLLLVIVPICVIRDAIRARRGE